MKTQLPSDLDLCQCEHNTMSVKLIGGWDHFPLSEDRHTAFELYRCRQCGKIHGFPGYNFQLALEQGTPEMQEILRETLLKYRSDRIQVDWVCAWYDFWVGWYWDRKGRTLYILPLPCLGVKIQFPIQPKTGPESLLAGHR